MTFGIDLKQNLREIILTILFKGWYLPSLNFFVKYFYFLDRYIFYDIINSRGKRYDRRTKQEKYGQETR